MLATRTGRRLPSCATSASRSRRLQAAIGVSCGVSRSRWGACRTSEAWRCPSMRQSWTHANRGVVMDVGIVMGSDSDWPVMEGAADALTEFGIEFEVGVVSAHRMPDDMIAYGRSAAERGLRVIIAGAGGAAHLPGMLASVTPLPVIGVPVPLQHLDGLDSLLSIVQMPAGVPVATVSVGGARNAGLLAARILGAGTGEEASELRQRMVAFQEDLKKAAQEKGARLRSQRSARLGFGS